MIDWNNMVKLYEEAGIDVIRVPIEDFHGGELTRLVRDGGEAVLSKAHSSTCLLTRCSRHTLELACLLTGGHKCKVSAFSTSRDREGICGEGSKRVREEHDCQKEKHESLEGGKCRGTESEASSCWTFFSLSLTCL